MTHIRRRGTNVAGQWIVRHIGVYLLACQVIERRREIGIRMALGSSAADVFGLVMRDGARITALGILVGLVGTVGMATVAFVATWLPARRAARVNPAAALSE